MSPSITLAAVALLSPIAAALLMVLLPMLRKQGMPAAITTIVGTLVSVGAAGKLLLDRVNGAADERWVFTWIAAGNRPVAEAGLNVDGTSVTMLFTVCLVALCVQIFSVSYMHDEPKPAFGRYFTLHALFLFSMNALVVAPNLLQLFAGWELVGLASYTLIGFYFAKPSAAKAAVKAFWMTKLADMGFLFGLLILFVDQGTFDWTAHPSSPAIATAITLMLFLATVGKSAQFPLHVWLPDAMEGPTPVSALLHAATMVAAGVFLVVRADPLFAQAETTRTVMLWVGAITATFASCLALVQNDIKKVLAFSTASQLGYMVTALGAGSAFAAYFHLGTHAFFKALLFLAAGSVIHGVHSNNLEDMGGLAKKMPITAATFIIGALSLAGFPGFAGFFSKDHIISTLQHEQAWVPWALLLGSAFLTALYMGRVILKAFFGKESEKAHHAHESGFVMTGPLLLLAVPSLGAGFLGSWMASQTHVHYEMHLVGLTPILAIAMGLGGLATSYFVYGQGKVFPGAELIAALDKASYVERFWEFVYRRVMLALASVLAWVDRYLIDGLMNWFGWAAIEGGGAARKFQTGRVGDYAWAVAVGAVVLALIGGWR